MLIVSDYSKLLCTLKLYCCKYWKNHHIFGKMYLGTALTLNKYKLSIYTINYPLGVFRLINVVCLWNRHYNIPLSEIYHCFYVSWIWLVICSKTIYRQMNVIGKLKVKWIIPLNSLVARIILVNLEIVLNIPNETSGYNLKSGMNYPCICKSSKFKMNEHSLNSKCRPSIVIHTIIFS